MSGGPAYIFLYIASTLASFVIPDREIGCAIIGAQSVGKSTLDSSINQGLLPVYQTRVPTTMPGVRNKAKLHLPDAPRRFRDYRDTIWDKRDFPHDAGVVRDQFFELRPEIVWWLLSADESDTMGWRDPYNTRVISELVEALKSDEYQSYAGGGYKVSMDRRGRMVAKRKKKRRRCRFVVMVINKMDVWDHLDPRDRAVKAQEVIDYHFATEPLKWLRDDPDAPQLLAVCASIERGTYRPHNQLTQPALPLGDLFTDIVREIAIRK
jgi:hypothetical protein